MPAMEFFYDFVSPYSYLASTRVEAEARRARGEVRFRNALQAQAHVG
jgi:2-hydroxychromene-2-carboxylate isomerase